MALEIFKRVEQKYLVTKEQFDKLVELSNEYIDKDPYYFTSINSLYFDTTNDDLIIKSMEKPVYKEKVRLRYYDKPTSDNNYFLEIKKKFKGVVYKRRVKISYLELNKYLKKQKMPKTSNNQIMKEIDYLFKYYNLKPAMYISYDRYSFIGKENKSFRLTFDTNIKYRFDDLRLENTNGEILLDDLYIMEVKTIGSLPLWFINILSNLKIYPSSYSKYGEAYKRRKIKCLTV